MSRPWALWGSSNEEASAGSTIAYEYRPDVVYLNVTRRCTNRCVFCARTLYDGKLGSFDLRLAREPSASELREAVAGAERERGRPFAEVVFCGYGEPCVRLDVVEQVGRSLRASGRSVRLNTNGHASLIVGGDPWPMLSGAIDEVNVSLNAPDTARYVALCQPRHGEDAFEATVEFIRMARQRVARATASVVGSVLDPQALEECKRLAKNLGVDLRVR